MNPRLSMVRHTQNVMGRMGGLGDYDTSNPVYLPDGSTAGWIQPDGTFAPVGQTDVPMPQTNSSGVISDGSGNSVAAPASFWQSLFSGLDNLAVQQQMVALNSQRAKQGLAPLTAAQITGGLVPGGVTAAGLASNPLIILGGLAVLALIVSRR